MIQNNYLSATINPLGAELTSLKNLQTGFEYIWQANPGIWPRHAPVLFPIVGEVNKDTFYVDGQPYTLKRHGFARDYMFEVSKQTENEIEFLLAGNENTLQLFPFDFNFFVGYQLEDKRLITTFRIENTGDKTLYFSVGAHPAFNLNGAMSDYYIEFEQPETLKRYLLKNNLLTDETEQITNNAALLQLSAELFDKDAIVLKDLSSKKLSLKNYSGDYSLTLEFDGFPYFGIWTKAGCTDFLCLEPWCGHADNAGFDGEFKDKEGIVALPPKEVFERKFSIIV